MKEEIESIEKAIEKAQSDLQERLRMLEEQAAEESAILEKIREDRVGFLAANNRSMPRSPALDPLQNDLGSAPRRHSWQHCRSSKEEEGFGRRSSDRHIQLDLPLKADPDSYGEQKLGDRQDNNLDGYGRLHPEEQNPNPNPNPRRSYGRQKLGVQQYIAERSPDLPSRSILNTRTSYGSPADRSNARTQQELQIAGFEMLKLVHKKLTAHMWSRMVQKLRSMKSDEERGEYLEMFRGEGTPFAGKPLSEATYAELLSFFIAEDEGERVLKRFSIAKPEKRFSIAKPGEEERRRGEVTMPEEEEEAIAMDAAENRGSCDEEDAMDDSDGEDAERSSAEQKERIRSGIREAMEAAELGFLQELKANGYDCSAANSIGAMEVRQQMEVYVRCHRQMKHLADRHHQLRSDLLSLSTINHTIQAQKLGILQPASSLIQLGCFLLHHGKTLDHGGTSAKP
jgi:hypothetical protein